MARLVLVGLPGVGKTSVARALADAWHCEALDTDDLLATRVGVSTPQYLRREGEWSFRKRELDALMEAVRMDAVVATGGGVVCSSVARGVLTRELTLWLDCCDEEIISRLDAIDRPLLGDDVEIGIARLRHERSAWYREVSKARIDASGSLDEVLERVRANIEKVET
ncbi:MAG: shikimate kinase [Acidimicrobiales bacterium]